MRIAKELAQKDHAGRVDLFLEDVEKRTLIGLNVPGKVHSMATNFWDFALAPLPLERPSPDLVLGRGRPIRSMSEWRLHPSVDFIIKPHKERGKAMFL